VLDVTEIPVRLGPGAGHIVVPAKVRHVLVLALDPAENVPVCARQPIEAVPVGSGNLDRAIIEEVDPAVRAVFVVDDRDRLGLASEELDAREAAPETGVVGHGLVGLEDLEEDAPDNVIGQNDADRAPLLHLLDTFQELDFGNDGRRGDRSAHVEDLAAGPGIGRSVDALECARGRDTDIGVGCGDDALQAHRNAGTGSFRGRIGIMIEDQGVGTAGDGFGHRQGVRPSGVVGHRADLDILDFLDPGRRVDVYRHSLEEVLARIGVVVGVDAEEAPVGRVAVHIAGRGSGDGGLDDPETA